MRRTEIMLESFLDGITGAGLFGRLRRPGAPKYLIDPRGLKEYKESGEYAATLARFGLTEPTRRSSNGTSD